MRYYCPVCGHGQSEDATCASCGTGPALDIEDERQRKTLEREDARWRRSRNMRFLSIAVVIGIAVLVVVSMIPGYSELRMRAFALPLGFDNVLLVLAVAFAADIALVKWQGKRRKFAFLTNEEVG